MNSGFALLFCSKPYFEMHISPGKGQLEGIHSHSLAGSWIQAHLEDFLNVNLKFIDPYPGAGGWGASSCQFLFVSLWSGIRHFEDPPSAQLLWKLYQRALKGDFSFEEKRTRGIRADFLEATEDRKQKSHKKGEAVFFNKGSGADLMAQWQGGITQFCPSPFFLRKRSWPFKEGDFFVLPTGYKVQTHKYLNSLSFENLNKKIWGVLSSCVMEGLRAFERGDWFLFLDSVNAFQKALEKFSFVTQNSLRLLQSLRQWDEVKAIKGCGALGGDTLLILFKKSDKKTLKAKLRSFGFKFWLSSDHIAEGLNATQSLSREGKDVALKPP